MGKGFGLGNAIMRHAFNSALTDNVCKDLGIQPPDSVKQEGNYIEIVQKVEGRRLKKQVKTDITTSSRLFNPIHTKGGWGEDPRIGQVVSEKHFTGREIMEINVHEALQSERFKGFNVEDCARTDMAIVAFMLYDAVIEFVVDNDADHRRKYTKGDYYYFPHKIYCDFLMHIFPDKSERLLPQSMWAAFSGIYKGLELNPIRDKKNIGFLDLQDNRYAADIPKEIDFIFIKELSKKRGTMYFNNFIEKMKELGGRAAEKIEEPEPTSEEDEIASGTEALESLDKALDNIKEMKGTSETSVAVSAFLNSLPDNKREASFEVTETGWKMKYVL